MTKKKLTSETIGVGVIFNSNGYVLIDKRLSEGLLGGLWEFPGGKKEKVEAIEQTIIREINEELDITVSVDHNLINFHHSYTHKRLHFQVFLCKLIEGTPKPLASQEIKWVLPNDLLNYPFPAANSKIIQALMEYLDETRLNEFKD